MLKANLEKILEEYIWFDPIEHVDVNDEENEKRTKELIDKATSQILKLLESVVPEEEKEEDLCHCEFDGNPYIDEKENLIKCKDCGKQIGQKLWNACREELLRRTNAKS